MSEPSLTPTIDEQNPWPGLREFNEAAERFFNGRGEESAALDRLVTQAPLTVLFGASGLGKTSLLQAGLFPLLRKEHFLPVYLRFDWRGGSAPLIEQARSELQAQIASQHVDAPAWIANESLWEYLHRNQLELWSPENYRLTPVLVLDQFEELFTIGAEHAEPVDQLKIDLADLIENRVPGARSRGLLDDDQVSNRLSLDRQRYKVVVSFREDFLPVMESLKRTIPSIMRNRLRLLPMSGTQAFKAVHETAPHLADADMAWRIVGFVAGRDESPEVVQSSAGDLAVEPALLSLVCAGLNERRRDQEKARFDRQLLDGTGQAIVEDFYRIKMADMPSELHRFLQRQLITERGYRKPCDLDDAIRVHGVRKRDLELLVDRRLLRIEPVRGTDRIELTHDLLTPVVRRDRDADRERERLAAERKGRRRLTMIGTGLGLIAAASVAFAFYARSLSQRAAAEAEHAGQLQTAAEMSAREARRYADVLTEALEDLKAEKSRTDDALKRLEKSQAGERQALIKAQDLARSEGVARNDAEQNARSATEAKSEAERLRVQEASQRTEAERLRVESDNAAILARTNEGLAKASSGEAERLRNLAVAQDLASRARLLQRDEDLPSAIQMVVRAYLLHTENCRATADQPAPCPRELNEPNVYGALYATLNRVTALWRRNTYGAGGIVSGSGGGTILRATPSAVLSARPGAGVTKFSLAGGWRNLAEAPIPPPVAVSAPADRRVTAMAMSPGGFPMAQALLDAASFEVWDETRRRYESQAVLFTGSGERRGAVSSHASSFLTLAFSPDSALIAAANAAGMLSIWREGMFEVTIPGVSTPPRNTIGAVAATPNERNLERSIRALLFAPANNVLLIATSRGIYAWSRPAGTGPRAAAATLLEGTAALDVRSLALSPDGRRLAFGDRAGAVRIGTWNPGTPPLTAVVAFGDTHLSPVNALAFSPSGRMLASAGADGAIRLFQTASLQAGSSALLEGHRGAVESVLFADDTLLYLGGADRTLRIWPLRMDAIATLLCRELGRRDASTTRATSRGGAASQPPQTGAQPGIPSTNACQSLPADIASTAAAPAGAAARQ